MGWGVGYDDQLCLGKDGAGGLFPVCLRGWGREALHVPIFCWRPLGGRDGQKGWQGWGKDSLIALIVAQGRQSWKRVRDTDGARSSLPFGRSSLDQCYGW